VRFGETLEQVAVGHGTTSGKLAEMNGIGPGELVRGGTLLLVPHATATAQTTTATNVDKPVAVVPADLFVYPGRKRVFYKVSVGDTVKEVADAMHVTVDELRRWNDIDPSSRLQEGMTLQAFVQEGADLSKIALLAENDVRVLTVGSEEFFAYFDKTRKRIVVTAKAGETIDTIGKRFGVSASTMERINRRSRGEVLKEGDTVAVYVSPTTNAPTSTTPSTSTSTCPLPNPTPLGALPTAPRMDLLPPTKL
jgi:membrane-bound lytic murein transglycosylase D